MAEGYAMKCEEDGWTMREVRDNESVFIVAESEKVGSSVESRLGHTRDTPSLM
jgi:hypothetical protein